MTPKKLTARVSVVFIAVGLTAVSIAAQSPVGYVVGIKGTWVLNGSNALALAETLPAGGSIRHRSSSPDDYITIADMRARPLESAIRNCANRDCSRVINLPREAPSNALRNAAGAVFGAIAETVRTSPHRKRLHQIRSGELSEAVVTLTDGKVNLSSVLKPEGEQYLRWHLALQEQGGVTEWTKPVKLEKSGLVFGLQPGLYELSLMRRNESSLEPLAEAWILVATPAEFEKTRASFLEVQELVKAWGEDVKPETRRVFLQAALENLAGTKMTN